MLMEEQSSLLVNVFFLLLLLLLLVNIYIHHTSIKIMNSFAFTYIQPQHTRSRIIGYRHTHSHRNNCYRPLLLVPLSLFVAVPSLRLACCASATLQTETAMAEEFTEEANFDAQKASLLVNDLRNTFKSGKTKSYEWRVTQIKSILKMVEEREKDIIRALQADLAKPELEAFISEISLTKGACKKALKELKRWMAPEKVKTTMTTYPSSAEIVSEPLGVVLVISAWNYPFLLSIEPVIGAISAGNAVVLKPSEVAPASSTMLAKLLPEYLDTDAIRVVEGAVPETTALLDQKWDKIFYTGSGRIGRIVMAAAVKHLTPVTLELGGKCPAIVDSTVNLQVAVRRIISGKWACNNGQACIGIDYIITTKSFASTLVDALKRGIEECFGENPIESKDIAGIVSSHHFNRLLNLLEEDRVPDRIVIGGQRDAKLRKIAPTVLFNVPEDTQIMQEEIFGPLLPIVTVDDIEDGFDIINSKPKPLAAYLFTNNENLKKSFVQNVSSGGMLINDAILHLTVPGLPFGGVGESGMGAYHGKFSFDTFSHKKSVMYRSFNGDSALRYPPFTAKKQRLLKALMNGSIIEVILLLLGWTK